MEAQLRSGSKAIKIEQKENKVVYVFDKKVSFEVDPNYVVTEIIGRGVYGVVAEGENKETKQKVAIKLIKELFRHPGEAKRELREIKILSTQIISLEFLKHKNIVSLMDIMKIEDDKNFNEVNLVLEFMQYNLKKLISSKKQISENMIKFILYQILDGLYHMHSADIIHRDLKPENILINNKLELKIADMNLARKEDDNPTRYVVTRPYRALEVLLSSNTYTKAIDIWSVGCIFAELIGRTVLFEGSDCIDQLKRFVAILGKPKLELYETVDPDVKESFIDILKEVPDRAKIDWKILYPHASTDALDLLDHMLEYDSKTRYSAEECMNHPFLKEIRQKSTLMKCQTSFDFSFDGLPMEIDAIKEAIYKESLTFHPPKRSRPDFKEIEKELEKDISEGQPRKQQKEE